MVLCQFFIYYFVLVDPQYVSLGGNATMSWRKYVTLEESIDLLFGDDNVCSEQAIVIVPPDQGDGYATHLE